MRLAAATLLLVLALAAPAAAASPVVATVGTATITKAQFDHWLRIATVSSAGPQTADRKVRIPRRGTRAWRDLRDQVMQLLIQNHWVLGEAALQGVTITDREVERAMAEQKQLSFPRERDYRDFLRTSGFTEADIRFRVRLEQLSNRLRERVTDLPRPTEAELRAYYDANRRRFSRASSFARARREVEAELRAEREHVALDAFIRSFQRRWRQVTTCREPYVSAACANARIPRQPVRPAAARPSTATTPPG